MSAFLGVSLWTLLAVFIPGLVTIATLHGAAIIRFQVMARSLWTVRVRRLPA
jgi:hypothetical protein